MNFFKLIPKISLIASLSIAAGLSLNMANNQSKKHQLPKINIANNFDHNKESVISYNQYLQEMKSDHKIINNGFGTPLLNNSYDKSTGSFSNKTPFTEQYISSTHIKILNGSATVGYQSLFSKTFMYNQIGIPRKLRFDSSEISSSYYLDFINNDQSLKKNSITVYAQVATYWVDIISSIGESIPIFNTQAKSMIKIAEKSGNWTKFQEQYSNCIIDNEIANRSVWLKLVISNLNQTAEADINDLVRSEYFDIQDLPRILERDQSTYNINFSPNIITLPEVSTDQELLPKEKLTLNSFNDYLYKLEFNSSNFIVDFNTDNRGNANNPAQWQPEELEANNLTPYNIFDEQLTWSDIYQNMINKFPELNQYFDTAIYLEKNSVLIYKSLKLLPDNMPKNSNNLYTKESKVIANYSQYYQRIFGYNQHNPDFHNLIFNHNFKDFLNDIKSNSNTQKKDNILKIIDWFYSSNLYKNYQQFSQLYIISITQLNSETYRISAVSDLTHNNNSVISIDISKRKFTFFGEHHSEILWFPNTIYLQYQGDNKSLIWKLDPLKFTKVIIEYNISGNDINNQDNVLIYTYFFNYWNYDNIYNNQKLVS